ncbi:hypothetical protein MTR67_046604 [Solanum verrucosum]|uniref:Chromo domain-containing protein n=1 Tax=Solanum verrucosum TaxID=315347 RepID=A0AAF0UX99_SOLVR|nr:hypothetical protein MTR67_046604 [Solanum verrucosum]
MELCSLAPIYLQTLVILKKYHDDGNYIIRWDSVLLDENLSYEEEPVAILNREVRKLRSKEIASIKVQWKNRPVEESTWESEVDMQERYPHLFVDSGTLSYPHLLLIVRGRTMGKLVSNVTTHLLVLSTRAFYFVKDFSIDFKWYATGFANQLERFGGIEEGKSIGEVVCLTSVLRWSKCTIDFDSPSALASLPHIRFQGELFLLARAGFSQLWCDVLGFRTWTNVSRRPLAREVQTLANDFMRLEILEKGGFLACVEARSSFLDKIKGKQFEDEKLSRIRDMVLRGEAKEASVGEVAYELALPPGLSGVHPVFHVSMLKKYHDDGNYIIRWDSVLLDENLSYEEEPVAILNREVRKLRSKEIASIKVQWKNRPVEESTWESEVDMQERYPHLFVDSDWKGSEALRKGKALENKCTIDFDSPSALASLPHIRFQGELFLLARAGFSQLWCDVLGFRTWTNVSRRPLAREVQTLANDFMRLEILEKGGFLACVEARSSFLDKIKGKQFEDEKLSRIRDMVLRGEAKEASVGEVAYELALPPGLSGVHPVFHVSMLKKYHDDGNYIIRWDSVLLDENLSYEEEPVAILNREVRKLRSKEIASIKVQWKNRPVEESTWESEVDMQERYPHLFVDSDWKGSEALRKGKALENKCTIDFDSPSALASLPHIRFQGELFLLARAGFSQLWCDVLGFRTWTNVSRRPLAREVQTLANDFMRLEILEKGGFLACVEARSSFLDKIKGKQFEDEKLSRIRDMVLRGEAKEASVGEVAYELALPPGLSGVHPVFHVSMLKKYHDDGNYIIRWDSVLLDENLSYEEEPVAILNREVRKLRSKEIASIKVQWKNRPVEESTWESEVDMQERYPHLFVDSDWKGSEALRKGKALENKCTIDFDSPSALASLPHIRFQGELFLLARAGFSQLWCDVLGFRTWTNVSRRPLAREVQTLANDFMRLEILEKGGFLACVEARSSFLDKIKGKQFEDEKLSRIRDMVLRGEAKEASVGEVAYELALPPGLSGVHPVFHVSMLKKYHDDGNYIIRWDSVLLDENLSYEEEPVAILNREVRKLRSKEIASIKVQWKNRPVEESTWESEVDMQERYPHLFVDSDWKGSEALRKGKALENKCTIDFDSPSALASLPHIRFQGELFLLARAGFSQLWCDVLGFRTWTNVSRRPLAREVQTLANDFMRLEILEKGGFLACVEARSSFLDKIKGKQFEDEKLSRIRDMVLRGEAKEASVGEVAYELALPPGLSGVHPVFHVSMLKKYHDDGNYIIRWDSVLLDENLSYEEEPVAILNREVRKLRSKEIASIKVQWKNRPVEESTWESEVDMQERYPHLFVDSVNGLSP